jgi:hypothetical protein
MKTLSKMAWQMLEPSSPVAFQVVFYRLNHRIVHALSCIAANLKRRAE